MHTHTHAHTHARWLVYLYRLCCRQIVFLFGCAYTANLFTGSDTNSIWCFVPSVFCPITPIVFTQLYWELVESVMQLYDSYASTAALHNSDVSNPQTNFNPSNTIALFFLQYFWCHFHHLFLWNKISSHIYNIFFCHCQWLQCFSFLLLTLSPLCFALHVRMCPCNLE